MIGLPLIAVMKSPGWMPAVSAGEPGIGTIVDALGGEAQLLTAGGGDLFAVALAADGALVWSAIAGGEGEDRAYAVDVRADGSFIVAGEYGGDSTSECGDPGHPATFGADAAIALDPAGDADGFVAAYGPGGEILWARSAGGPCADWIRDVVALADGSIVATGVIEGPATFGTGEAN